MPVVALFPIIPLLLLISAITVIALISIILSNFENSQASEDGIDSGLFVLIGCILTLAIIGFFVALAKTIEAFMLKNSMDNESNEEVVGYNKLKKTSLKDFLKYISKLILLMLLGVVVVALAAVIVEKGEIVSNSSFIFAAIILAFSAFSTLLMIMFIVIRFVEYSQMIKNDAEPRASACS